MAAHERERFHALEFRIEGPHRVGVVDRDRGDEEVTHTEALPEAVG